MNKRQVIILWAVALVLGSAVGIVKLTQKDTTKSASGRTPGQTLFESFPATDVAAVEIKGADGAVNLAKRTAAGRWASAMATRPRRRRSMSCCAASPSSR